MEKEAIKLSLVEQINEDVKTAMKNQDKEKLNVIRMVKSALQMAKINAKHDLSDEEAIDVIDKQIKMRNDSIDEFGKAGREDLVKQYQSEVDILKTYMPEQLSKEEVEKIIEEAFKEINPTSPKQMGLIMKTVTPKVKGRYDMKEISTLIKDKLNNQ